MMEAVLGRRRWWAKRMVAGYAAACALLAVLQVVGVDGGGRIGEALVVLTLPTSLLALSLVSVAEMTLNGVLHDGSPAWTVMTIAVWTLALVGQTVLVARLVLDGSRAVRADRATRVVGSPRRWTPRRRGRSGPGRTLDPTPPGHGRTVRI